MVNLDLLAFLARREQLVFQVPLVNLADKVVMEQLENLEQLANVVQLVQLEWRARKVLLVSLV